MLRIVMTCLVASVAGIWGACAETAMDRGSYLVNAIMACDGCHTPRPGGGALDMTKRFSGGSQVWDEPHFLVRGSNISSDPAAGIGIWSDADFKRLMWEGVRPNGVKVAPQMPFAFYKILTSRDLDAVTAYLRSVTPQSNKVQPPVYKAAMHYEDIPGGEKPFTDEVLNDSLKRGFYVATIAHCMECHARHPDGSPGYKDSWGRGGHVMKGPYGEAKVSNITSHPTKGIGALSDAEIKRALTQGIGHDGRKLKPPMARQEYFSKMSDADLNSLIAWVRTMPPLE
jgi:mono/diheme cytochrome c family protein